MKNERTPRSLAESYFEQGYPIKSPRPKEHASTWFIIALGLIGFGIIWWTR